jgi:hypothetical protein
MAIINQGEVLHTGNPLESIQSIEGQIWSKTIEKEELDSYQQQYNVISERLIAGKPEIHVHSETRPDETFESKAADLEDVYFSKIKEFTATEAVA